MFDDITTVNTPANVNDSVNQEQLNKTLEQFNQPPIQATARGTIYPGATETEEPVVTEKTEEQEETNVTEETDNPQFVEAFKQYFGVDPNEALTTFNELNAFRDELTLQRAWDVNGTEYNQRMSQVREVYEQLPEEGRQQFNTVQGAQAIWEHLIKTGQAKANTSKSNAANTRASFRKPAPPKQTILSKAEILSLPKSEYNKRLPEITKAFREGRVK